MTGLPITVLLIAITVCVLYMARTSRKDWF